MLLFAPSAHPNSNVAPKAKTAIKAPESFLRLQRIQKKRAASALRLKASVAKKVSAKKAIITKKAAKYAAKYAAAEKRDVLLHRQARASNQYYVPAESKIVLVIRILGIFGVSPKVRKVLQLLRLRQINNATFLRVNKATLHMLVHVAPYITWGAPNLKTVSDLIYKRGYAKLSGNRVALTNNTIIETTLGKYGVVCIEDLIHQIYTCGKYFKQCNSFLWPFKLNTPTGGWVSKKTGFNEGGDAGDRKSYINNLVRKMC